MDWSTIGKYCAGAALMGSVLYLVIEGKTDAQVYVGLVTGALGALGIHTASTAMADKIAAKPPTPVIDQPAAPITPQPEKAA